MNYQKSEKGCGTAATRNLLELIYKNANYESASFTRELNDFAAIREGLGKYGVTANGYEIDNCELDRIKRPFIAQIVKDDGYHFLVVKKGVRHLSLVDSAIGKIKMTRKNFLKVFTGKILEVKKIEPGSTPKIRLCHRRESVIFWLLSFLECGSLVVSFALQTFLGSWYFLIGGLALAVAIALGKKNYVLHIGRRIDLTFILPFYRKTKDGELYEKCLTIKNDYLKNVLLLSNQIEVIFAMVVMAALQDIYLFICSGIVLVFSFAICLLLTPHLKKKEFQAEITERQIRSSIRKDDENKMQGLYKRSCKISNGYIFYYYLIRMIPGLLALITFASILFYQNNLSIESLVFNVGYLAIISISVIHLVDVENYGDFHLSALADLPGFEMMKKNKRGVLTA